MNQLEAPRTHMLYRHGDGRFEDGALRQMLAEIIDED